jgi:hypothetical protein
MNNKIPTDDNLMLRGCVLPSMCSFCKMNVESTFHIFFECDYAIRLWSWLANILNMVMQFTPMEDMWKLCDMNWSPQCKITVTAALVNLINDIWFARNQVRYHNKHISRNSLINLIIANTSLFGNNSKKSCLKLN